MDRVKPIKPTFTRYQRDRTAGLILISFSIGAIAWYHFYHQVRPLNEKALLTIMDRAAEYYDSLDAATIPHPDETISTIHASEKRKIHTDNYPEVDVVKSLPTQSRTEAEFLDLPSAPATNVVAWTPQSPSSDSAPAIKRAKSGTNPRNSPERKIIPIDINRSEALDWESLPGIGPYYAKKILAYRDKLGGFYKKEQVRETWKLPDSTYQKIAPFLIESSTLRTMDLNQVDIPSLASHPYLTWKDANLIVRYRQQHGRYLFIEDLFNIHAFDSTYLSRVIPYFKVEPTNPPITSGGAG